MYVQCTLNFVTCTDSVVMLMCKLPVVYAVML